MMERIRIKARALQRGASILWEEWAYRKVIRASNRRLTRRQISNFIYYLSVYFFCVALPSWTCMTIWYTSVKICGYSSIRSHVDGFCMQPFHSPGEGLPWFFDLWENGDSHTRLSNTTSPEFDTIMVGHLKVDEALAVLRRRARMLYKVSLNIIDVDELRTCLDRVETAILNVAPRLNKFSRMFCEEKDAMNHVLRTFVQVYATTLTWPIGKQMTLGSILLYPQLHLARFMIRQSHPTWESALYSWEIETEVGYRKDQLIQQLRVALDRVDANDPASRSSHQLSRSSHQLLKVAIENLVAYQRKLKPMIKASPRSKWLLKSDETVTLEGCHKLAEQVYNELVTLEEAMITYEINVKRLCDELRWLLENLQKTSSFGFLSRGSLEVPASLLAEVENVPFLSRIRQVSDNATEIESHSHVFLYDLHSIDDTKLSSLRSQIARICEAQKNSEMVSNNLYAICLIYNVAKTMSSLDDDPLSSVQRSWVKERREAIDRWWQQKGYDDKTLFNNLAQIEWGFEPNILVPQPI